MSNSSMRPDYGLDAPGLCRSFFMAGLIALTLGIGSAVLLAPHTHWGWWLGAMLAVPAFYLLGMGGFMVYESRITKVRERERLLDLCAWRGDETVLDVGCGRGLMLIGAAHRLRSGRAIGIDIWQAEDQSANTPVGALQNASLEGVAERVSVQTADMRSLPFPDQTFDIALTHWAVHNLKREADREVALAEVFRVLRSGGQFVLADIEHRDAYSRDLDRLGFVDRRVVFSPVKDAVLRLITFGSFRPACIFARKP